MHMHMVEMGNRDPFSLHPQLMNQHRTQCEIWAFGLVLAWFRPGEKLLDGGDQEGKNTLKYVKTHFYVFFTYHVFRHRFKGWKPETKSFILPKRIDWSIFWLGDGEWCHQTFQHKIDFFLILNVFSEKYDVPGVPRS